MSLSSGRGWNLTLRQTSSTACRCFSPASYVDLTLHVEGLFIGFVFNLFRNKLPKIVPIEIPKYFQPFNWSWKTHLLFKASWGFFQVRSQSARTRENITSVLASHSVHVLQPLMTHGFLAEYLLCVDVVKDMQMPLFFLGHAVCFDLRNSL